MLSHYWIAGRAPQAGAGYGARRDFKSAISASRRPSASMTSLLLSCWSTVTKCVATVAVKDGQKADSGEHQDHPDDATRNCGRESRRSRRS